MPRTPKQIRLISRPAIGPLVRQFAGDSVRWADAELALARAELHVLGRRLSTAVIFAAAGLAALLAAIITLAEAGVAAAAVYLGSDIVAGLAVAAALLGFAAFCVMAMRRMFTWGTDSVIFRWITGDHRRASQWTR
ncbi:MAG: phage holin family protein [Hyphomicrobiales bacterium]